MSFFTAESAEAAEMKEKGCAKFSSAVVPLERLTVEQTMGTSAVSALSAVINPNG